MSLKMSSFRETYCQGRKSREVSHTERFVVQGSRAISNEFGKDNGLSIYCPIIVKYRDEKTVTSTKLEDYLR